MPDSNSAEPVSRHPVEASMRQACADSANKDGASGAAASLDLRHHKELNAAEPETAADMQLLNKLKER